MRARFLRWGLLSTSLQHALVAPLHAGLGGREHRLLSPQELTAGVLRMLGVPGRMLSPNVQHELVDDLHPR